MKSTGTESREVQKAKPTVEVIVGTGRSGVRSETFGQEREHYAWLGKDVASFLKEAEDKRTADGVALTVSKRLQQKPEATEAAQTTPWWSMQGRELKEVADECGAGAKIKTSISCCLEEVEDLKECERGQREPLQEVATEGQTGHENPESRRAPPGW